jgi:MFS family permease
MATTNVAGLERADSTAVFNRWMIPVAAVAVHICIGSVYAWSTFNRPIKAEFPTSPWWFSPPYTQFTSALVLLGLSAAFLGPWVERRGPRAAATAAACFFGSGLVIGGIGLWLHQSVVAWLGMGIIAGIGCGLGYISPVSTLVKWFPDRRGMATGFAIMGFGGGAFLAGYLNPYLMSKFSVAKTLMMLGAAYFIIMMIGARIIRRPPVGWKPANYQAPTKTNPMITTRSVSRNYSLGTVQFYLLWGILFINVTAGIGILAQASPMFQDLFRKTALQAGLFVSLISVFNACGRIFWASLSDFIGRRMTYITFFVVQFFLFLLIPKIAADGKTVLFEVAAFTVFTMYGGGFSTVPAFLADLFGEENVGAIHGVLLTAWSAAAVVGPVIITQLSERAKATLAPGASRVHIYDQPLRVLAFMLVVGFILTLLVRPLKQESA